MQLHQKTIVAVQQISNWVSMSVRGPDRKVTDDELINAIEKPNCPFATSSDIASEVSLSQQRVHQRLKTLHDKGVVNRAKTGGVIIYWLEPCD